MHRTVILTIFVCAIVSPFFFLFSDISSLKSSLDQYLLERGYDLSPLHSSKNEGYCTNPQRMEFIKDCQRISGLKKVLEIGFNAGHSSETFLESCKEVTVISFDINAHPYTQVGAEYMLQQYPERFTFIPGDSAITLNTYAQEHPNEKFDLIFIDGCHEYFAVLKDIMNCQNFAHSNTLVWLDDYLYIGGVTDAVQTCINQGVLQILEVKSTKDYAGERSWAIAKYKNP